MSESPFQSVLTPEDARLVVEGGEPPYFRDLNLDQVVARIVRGYEEYELGAIFRTRLSRTDDVLYRQEVFSDLEVDETRAHVVAFAGAMRTMRRQLAQVEQRYYARERQGWFLLVAATYAEAVTRLDSALAPIELGSRGMRGLRDHLHAHVESAEFKRLAADIASVTGALAAIRFAVNIKGPRVTITRFAEDEDYGAAIVRTFERFRQGKVAEQSSGVQSWPENSHVSAQILERVARFHSDAFVALDEFCTRHRQFSDALIGTFDCEVQFYIAYLAHCSQLQEAGLRFCHPRVSSRAKTTLVRDAFDMALAQKLVAEGAPVVTNDIKLDGPERAIVVSGPNQGGKTTFARMFGQLHHLAAIGCPVPGTRAQLMLCDRLFTHFERQENIATLAGKLEEELQRVHAILEQAGGRSVVVMNESFSSTSLHDAFVIGRAVIGQLVESDLLCVYVTFIDELSRLSPATVSMVSSIDVADPAARTFKILRRPADGLAYAAALAAKYRLGSDQVGERLRG